MSVQAKDNNNNNNNRGMQLLMLPLILSSSALGSTTTARFKFKACSSKFHWQMTLLNQLYAGSLQMRVELVEEKTCSVLPKHFVREKYINSAAGISTKTIQYLGTHGIQFWYSWYSQYWDQHLTVYPRKPRFLPYDARSTNCEELQALADSMVKARVSHWTARFLMTSSLL